jgi:hypothetical protein
MTMLLVLITTTSGYFLQISPGVISQGLGGASIVVNEGLPAFHNPAMARGKEYSLVASRWLFSTSMFTAGACFKGFSCGLSSIYYGSIQGYDADGNMTDAFNPFSICFVIAQKLGSFGVAVKGFGEKIETQSLAGACASVSTYTELGMFRLGTKVDNLGREFLQNTTIPPVFGIGVSADITDAVRVTVESKIPDIEINAGVAYTYHSAVLVFGVRYLPPQAWTGETQTDFTISDVCYSGGIVLHLGDYAVGYAFVLREYWITHSLALRFIPGP